ncbi:MAG: hypothetical protein WC091_21235 [Sulfuricellaceae bacterium]
MHERPINTVPKAIIALLMLGLCLQVAWHFSQPRLQAQAEDLPAPPSLNALHLASLGEPVALAKLLLLNVQAYDNQPGISIPLRKLDYARVEAWLALILQLDPRGQYPLLLASQVYGGIPDEAKQRQMAEFVYREFLIDPERRWQWLAYAAITAKHRLHDLPLARKYAQAIRLHATGRNVSPWARQMEIFILEDMNELESAKVLLGGLLETGQITDPHEIRFLAKELDTLAGK